MVGDIERAADAIIAIHETSGNYIDARPIAAALSFVHANAR